MRVRGLLPRAIAAGAAYWATVFACGFVLGTARFLMVAPRIGEVAAVALEVPLMLAASWILSRWCAARFLQSDRMADRIAMGVTAFVLLMAAEMTLAVLVFQRSLSAHLSSYGTSAGIMGLSAQFIFAAIPLAQARPLAAVRLIHTIIYLVMTASTLFIIYAALSGVYGDELWISIGLITLESIVFVGNGFKCPLSTLASRYGAGEGRLFDAFLPVRVTRYTVQVFVPLILLGMALLAIRWLALPLSIAAR